MNFSTEPAVPLDDLARERAEGAQAGVHVLRVRLLAHGGEADEVAEEHGDGLALLGERRPASDARRRPGQKRASAGPPAPQDGHALSARRLRPHPRLASLPHDRRDASERLQLAQAPRDHVAGRGGRRRVARQRQDERGPSRARTALRR